MHSVYMNLLYIRILATNKVKRALKHVSLTYFFAFFWRCYLNLQLPIWGVSDCSATNVRCTCELQFPRGWGYIWWYCYKCHMHMCTAVGGNIQWLCHKCHMYMWTAVVGGSEGCHLKILNSFWVWLLLQRGLFYERPMNVFPSISLETP